MITRLAVIPARGGSTRLKDKNIRLLGGRPLIVHTIETVIDSGEFDTIIVSTDSQEIKDVAKDYDVEIYDRPAEYATEKATVLSALIAMMQDVERHDVFSYFLPTCPFRKTEDISKAIEILRECDSVVSISEYSEPIQLAMIKRNDSVFPVFDNLTSGLTNSKFIQKYYKPNGSFYMSHWSHIREHKNFFVGNVKGVEIPRSMYVDIDTAEDLEKAEEMISQGILF
tara:strand:+ start:1749 stop:2426 length:678 start_codon:yes stop_codon:yes gene_type:complete